MLNSRALLLVAGIGTILQVGMVLAGHSNKTIAGLFAVGGMAISLLAGVTYSVLAQGRTVTSLALGGSIAGGLCALIGILVSYLLGDVPATLLIVGSLSSAVTGGLGGLGGRLLRRTSVAFAIIVALAGLARSADAQAAATGIQAGPVAATTQDFAWLTGRWQGRMTNEPGVADVTFAPPNTGLITGVMRLVKDGQVLVVELISMVDTPNGLEMRFRHFSPTLVAYESTFRQSMRLTKHEVDGDTFENTVPFEKGVLSTQPRVTIFHRVDRNTFVGHTDVVDDQGKASVVEVTYRRLPS